MMELWYRLVSLLPFSWAQAGSLYFMKNALLAVLVVTPLFGLLSTHDFSNLADYADKVVLMKETVLKVGSAREVMDSAEFAAVFHLRLDGGDA